MNLPDAPSKKPNPIVRVGIAALVVLILGGGGWFLSTRSSSLSPDDKATAFTAQVAYDVVTVISGNDTSGLVSVRVQAAVTRFSKDSGCKFLGGTVTFGNTEKQANATASAFIYKVRNTPQGAAMGENLGMGYTVVSTRGLIEGEKFAAVIAAVDCSPPAPATPGLGS